MKERSKQNEAQRRREQVIHSKTHKVLTSLLTKSCCEDPHAVKCTSVERIETNAVRTKQKQFKHVQILHQNTSRGKVRLQHPIDFIFKTTTFAPTRTRTTNRHQRTNSSAAAPQSGRVHTDMESVSFLPEGFSSLCLIAQFTRDFPTTSVVLSTHVR